MKSWVRGAVLASMLLAVLGSRSMLAEDQPPLTMPNLMALAGAGLSDKEIAAKVAKRGIGFDTHAGTAAELKEAGMGELGIKAVMEAGAHRKKGTASGAPKGPAREEDGLGQDPGPATPPTAKPKTPVADDPLPQPGPRAQKGDDPLPMPKAQAPGAQDGVLPVPKAQAPRATDDDPLPLPAAKPDPAKAAVVATKPTPPKKLSPIEELQKNSVPEEGTLIGPRAADEDKKKVLALFQKLVADTPLKLKIDSSKHVTLIASSENLKTYLPGIKALEEKLERTFPGLIKAGTDKRNTIIVLVDSQADFRTWITAEFHLLGMDKENPKAVGEAAGVGNQLTMAMNSRGSYIPFAAVMDLSAYATETDRNTSIAYAVGYLYMRGICEGGASDCFVTGFGNYCEQLMYNNPMSRVISYEERKLAGEEQISWSNQVKEAIKQRTCSKASAVLNFSTVTMKSLHYAEAWSFVAFLCKQPKDFDNLVLALRDKNAAQKGIEAYYRLKDDQLNYQWQVWANAQN